MASPRIQDTPRRLESWARGAARLAISADARWDARCEWGRRLRGEPPLPPGPIRRVLVICYGNICRSAFAAPLLAARSGLEIRGAGFSATEGKPAEPGAVRGAQRFGVDLTSHAAHRLSAEDVEWSDLILGMEGHHVGWIARHFPSGRPLTRLLGDYLAGPPHAIDDPWGESDAVFDATFDRIAASVDRVARLVGGSAS